MTRRVLVTGAGGFVGRHIFARLASDGWLVRAATRSGATVPGAENVTFGAGDAAALEELVSGCAAVVHAAGRAHVMREFESDPLAAFRRDNVELTRSLAVAAAAAEVRTFVFLSSIAAITNSYTERVSDLTPAEPDTDYGRSKREAEAVLDNLAAACDMRVVMLRPPMIFGEGMRGNPLRLFFHVWRGLPVPCVRPPVSRSVMYVGDVASRVARALERDEVRGAFCIAGGEAISTETFVRATGAALGRPARVILLPASLVSGIRATLGVTGAAGAGAVTALGRLTQGLTVDDGRFVQLAGDVLPLGVEYGLLRTAAWFRSEFLADSPRAA